MEIVYFIRYFPTLTVYETNTATYMMGLSAFIAHGSTIIKIRPNRLSKDRGVDKLNTKNIFDNEELEQDSTISKMETVQLEGGRHRLLCHDLPMRHITDNFRRCLVGGLRSGDDIFRGNPIKNV